MICIKCSKEIPAESVFCMFCGKKQSAERKKSNRQRGNGQGYIYSYKGKYVAQITLGYRDGKRKTFSQTFVRKKDAVAALSKMISEKYSIDKNIRFSEAFERMIELHSRKAGESTINGYKYAFKHFEPIHNMKLEDIKTEHLQSCVDECASGKRTKVMMRVAASLTMKYGMQNDIIDKNYADFVTIEREEAKERDPFTQDEIRKIYESVGIVPYADYILCLIFTGFRPNEMFSLEQKDYHEHSYFIGGSKTEAGKNRIVPVPNVIKGIVEAQTENGSNYIFPSADGGKMDLSNFRKRFYYPALEQIGVRSLPPYSCRHTYATMLKNIDAPTTDKQRLMGHSSFSMTAHYTHTDVDSLERITNSLSIK